MSSDDEDLDQLASLTNNALDLFANDIKGGKAMSDTERKERARMMMINKRVDELIEVLD